MENKMTSQADYGKSAYPVAKPRKTSSNNVGSVTGRPTRTYTIDVSVDRIAQFEHDDASEFVITMNGRILTRMSAERARRMGVIE